MTTDKKLEQYLTQLDKALGGIAVSDRADIVTEIRSHVLEAQDREPTKSIESILASMGEAETVANRFLMERGLKPVKAPKTPMVKWLTIGFLGTFGISVLFIFVLIYKFTPLVKVDDNAGTVQILGGLIDISDKDSRSQKIMGSEKIDPKKTTSMKIIFSNGKFTLSQSSSDELKWDCKSSSNSSFPKMNGKTIEFDFNDAKCEISIPKGLALDLDGENAKVVMDGLTAPLKARFSNGKVSFIENKGTHYKYDLKVNNGKIDSFESSSASDAVLIKMDIGNGKISKS